MKMKNKNTPLLRNNKKENKVLGIKTNTTEINKGHLHPSKNYTTLVLPDHQIKSCRGQCSQDPPPQSSALPQYQSP